MKKLKIKSIKKIAHISDRYDITVADNHNFLANNVLVHNCNNAVSSVKRAIEKGQTFGISIKRDGSSHSTYMKVIEDAYKTGVCSRSMEKSMEQKYITDYVDNDGNVFGRYIDPETKTKGWYCFDTKQFFTEDEIVEQGFKEVSKEVHDSWVDLAHSSGLIKKGLEYCKEHNLELAFRGEIFGSGLKGSGNKLNPDSNNKQTLCLFGIDDLSEGYAKRINYSSEHNLKNVAEAIGVEYTEVHTITPTTYEELCKFCDDIIKAEAEAGRIIEGVVVRSHYTNDISVKYMNPYYDSKK